MAALPTQSAIPPQVQAEVDHIMRQDADNDRGAVYAFDPDATPEQKAAATDKNVAKLAAKPDLTTVNGNASKLPVDTAAPPAVPTITIQDVDHQPAQTNEQQLVNQEQPDPELPQPPGAIPSRPAPEIPDWYTVGWRDAAGVDKLSTDETRAKGLLDSFLAEQYYGDWYHNAAVITVTVIITHYLTRFNFGWGWLFIVLAFCSTYYSASVSRFRRNARDDIQRELVKTRLMSEHESADWMNHFLDRFWLIYEPVLSKTVINTVEQILSSNCPPFLDSIRLTFFTLGTKAPRIDSVRTFPRTPDDIVMMDWGFSFKPNDTSDLTKKQAARIVNPRIIITVRVGAGLATAAMPILVEDFSFSGLLRVKMKLMTSFPHVQLVELSFLEPPVFDYVLKPIGGDFGFDIGNVPGLSAFIRDTVHSILGPMMYDPNIFTLNLEQLLGGEPLDSSIGVLQVTIHSARGIKGGKLGAGTPDPYVTLSINGREELARTKFKHNTANPSWGETKFLLIQNLTETLSMTVWDFNDHRKNTVLGQVNFDLSKLSDDATQEGIEENILKDGKEKGVLRFDVSFYPVLKPEVTPNGVEEPPETSVGIVRLTLHQAKDLDNSKSMSGELNPFAKVYLNTSSHPVHTTHRFKHTNDPVWESATEFLCSDRTTTSITVKVIDDRDFLKDPIVGYMTVKLADLLEAKKTDAGRDWWPLAKCKSGKLRLSAEWKPLDMAGSLHGVDQYVPPIGVVRLWLQRATDVKNVEATLGGKSDPYVRVQINNVTQGRTEVINNNLNPEWDQIIYIPVHSLKETMLLECMDYQHLTRDRSLGNVELKVSELAQAGEQGSYMSTGKKEAQDPLRLDKGTNHGTLSYVAEFIPAILIRGLKFHGGINELQRVAKSKEGAETDGETVPNDSSSDSSDDEDVPEGVTATTPMQDSSRIGHKKAKSTDTTATSQTVESVMSKATQASSKPPSTEELGIEMSKEELLKHQSGIIIFNVLSGHIKRKARLEVLLDDAYWPAFGTIKARSRNAEWEHIGEGFIKELDFSRVWLRLNVADEGEKDDIIAQWKGDTKPFLQDALAITFRLTDKDDPDEESSVVIEARYLPVPIVLEPRESVNNQGSVRVELMDGHDIHGADRGGKSDPFAVFELNGQKVFKSQTKKKTLHPEWNENFVVQVPSRINADFKVELFDWNQIEQAKSLGSAKIDVADLEPFKATEKILYLQSEKHGNKGYIRVSLVFTPEIIAKSRKNTSTFSTAGRAMTQIGHLPVGAGRGVVSGVTGVFRRDHARKGSVSDSDDEEKSRGFFKGSISDLRKKPSVAELGDIPEMSSTGQASRSLSTLAADGSVGYANGSTETSGAPREPGTLKVTVVDAKDLSMSEIKPYVVVRVGEKENKTKHVQKTANPDWEETFQYTAGAGQTKLYAWVYDHKTLGKDKLLGAGEVEIWRHARPNEPVEVSVQLAEGQGLLRLRLDFDPDLRSPRPSASSGSLHDKTPVSSPSRFSLSRRRDRED
ncbi:tricalbin [Abortiporus biennis]|nr:tricalbin [Abortiporus biennis]